MTIVPTLRATGRGRRPGAFLLVVLALTVGGCSSSTSTSGSTGGRASITAVAAEDVWGSILRQLAGDRAKVTSIIGDANVDPHSYDATSSDGVKWVEDEFDALWKDSFPLPDAIIEEIQRVAERVEIRFSEVTVNELPAAALAEMSARHDEQALIDSGLTYRGRDGQLAFKNGLNVPDVVLPLAALTDKDRTDLAFALDQGVDWVALSFVQRPEDVAEARRLIAGRASLLAKIEKPAAVDRLEGILELADAVMVARGDLGVELPPEEVPPLQKRIVEAARRMGRPVVVATQMLESMITAPTPTRAEVSDVATAVYDGADAVMLSAESASGQYPCEAVAMMNRIATSIEADPSHGRRVHFTETLPEHTTADAIAQAAATMVGTIRAAAIVCFTTSGSTARRISRERPAVPLLVLTPSLKTARKLGILWGAHAVRTRDISSFEEMIAKAKRMALRHRIAKGGDRIVIIAGVPFGTPGSTNVIHSVRLIGDELERHRAAQAKA